jgi:hypothetical protein
MLSMSSSSTSVDGGLYPNFQAEYVVKVKDLKIGERQTYFALSFRQSCC